MLKRAYQDDHEDVAPDAADVEAELGQHALAAHAQRRQHARVQRGGEEERVWRIVELVDLREGVQSMPALARPEGTLRNLAAVAERHESPCCYHLLIIVEILTAGQQGSSV